MLLWRFFGGPDMPATKSWAVREGNWKLSSHWSSKGDETWLVDLADDPGESRNVRADRPEIVTRLTVLWERWNATLAPPTGRDNTTPPGAARREDEG